jgi:hypothetical protein
MDREEFLRFIWGDRRSLLVDKDFNTTKSVTDADYYLPAIATSREKTGFVESNVLWVDYDHEVLHNRHVADPSIVINSGKGVHLLWRLRKPIVDATILETLNKTVANKLDGDDCWNSNRLLRLPGSYNTKYDQVKLVKVERHSVDRFLSFTQVLAPNDRTRQLINEIPNDRSSSLYYVAATYKDYGYDLEFIRSVILPEYDKNWKKYTDRPEEYDRIIDKIRNQPPQNFSGLRTIQQATPPAPANLLPGHSQLADNQAGGVAYSKHTGAEVRALTLNELLTQKTEIDWIIKGVLPERGLLIITGAPGIGKTSISIYYAMILARTAGKPDPEFTGYEHSIEQTVLFLSLEMHYGGILYFVKQMMPHVGDWNLDIHFFAPTEVFKMEHLVMLIEQTKCTGIVIDTLSMLTSKSLNDDDTMKKVMDDLNYLQNHYNLWIWLIHHQRKASPDNKKPFTLADMYGSQFIAARADTVLCVVKENIAGAALRLAMIKNRYAPDNREIVLYRKGALWFTSSTRLPQSESLRSQLDSTQKPPDSTTTTPNT